MVPDHLPPAVTVTTEDWKLIRLFHEGENGAHAYRLYNLKDDIGETHDLSSEQPERVKALDSHDRKFLSDTQAVVPMPNPAYNPTPSPPRPSIRRGTPACRMAEQDGMLVITQQDGDAFISRSTGKSPVAVKFRARSADGGAGRIEWLPNPTADKLAKTVEFHLKPGEWTRSETARSRRAPVPELSGSMFRRVRNPSSWTGWRSLLTKASHGVGISNNMRAC